MVHRLLAMSWIAWPIRDKDAIKVMADLMNGIVVRKSGDGGSTGDETSEDVLFNTTVDECYV